jgi:hypothetical protein
MAMDLHTAEQWRTLIHGWDEAYQFAHDPKQPRPFTATRRDDPTVILRADNPDDLWGHVNTDYRIRPVPRQYAP